MDSALRYRAATHPERRRDNMSSDSIHQGVGPVTFAFGFAFICFVVSADRPVVARHGNGHRKGLA